MRTTLRIDDDLYAEVKQLASRTGRTVTAVIEDALRSGLARGRATQRRGRPPVRLTTYRGKGLQPGVDLDDSASLLDLMEGFDGPA